MIFSYFLFYIAKCVAILLGSSPFALRFCPIAFAIDFDVKLNTSPTIITTKPIITEGCLNLSQ